MNVKLKVIFKYSLITILIAVILFLTPIFYQTHKFFNSNYVSFSEIPSPDTTEVYIIGTRHYPTATYNIDTLYKNLERIQPDIILLEFDSSFFIGKRLKWQYPIVLLQYEFLRKYKNLEMLSATKYSRNHNDVIIGPFEWELTTNHYEETQGKKRSELMKALYNSNSDTANQVLAECGQLNSYTISLPTLPSFNTFKNDSLMKRFIYLEYEIVPNLVLANDSLNLYHDLAQKFKNYWPTRNLHMANNILRIVQNNPTKRIAVLTGFRHRYLLRSLLSKKMDNYNFKLLDYKSGDIIQ